jgi:cell division protein FtsB
MSSRLITFAISIFSLVFIVSIGRSIYSLWQKGSIVAEREAIRDELKKENTELKKKLSDVEDPEYIEQQAREKLNLQREGEIVVVLPKDLGQTEEPQVVLANEPNWKQWWRLFF